MDDREIVGHFVSVAPVAAGVSTSVTQSAQLSKLSQQQARHSVSIGLRMNSAFLFHKDVLFLDSSIFNFFVHKILIKLHWISIILRKIDVYAVKPYTLH